MHHILVTGFEAFNKESVNPTQLIIQNLEYLPPTGVGLITHVLPVDAQKAPLQLNDLLDRYQPEIILMMGLASRRAQLTLERVAINLLDFEVADNSGRFVHNVSILPAGPTAYFSTWPAAALVKVVCDAGVPAKLSYTAGTYICNQVLYLALNWAAKQRTQSRIGFLHTPPLPQQVVGKKHLEHSMALETMIKAVTLILSTLSAEFE